MISRSLILVLLVSSLPVHAIGVTPTRIIFESSGNNTHEIFITGDYLSPLAVEITMVSRSSDSHEIVSGKNACLSLSLPQFYIEPNQLVAVFIQHRNYDPECQRGSFYVVVETLNIAGHTSSGNNRVSFASRLFVPLHINPGSLADVKMTLANERKLSMTNSGIGAVLYSTFDLQLDTGIEWVSISGQRLAHHFQSDALLPAASVTFDPTDFLADTDFRAVRIVPRAQAFDRGE